MPNQYENLSHPTQGAAVTPHDDNDLTNRGILYVGSGGDIVGITTGGDTLTLSSVPTGTFIPIMFSRVLATSTTASDIVVLY